MSGFAEFTVFARFYLFAAEDSISGRLGRQIYLTNDSA
jgi:hypothetical protein